ncbi:MAG TPA: PRC-barrel domain-containing protein [Gemmatimonadaceae bacterium]
MERDQLGGMRRLSEMDHVRVAKGASDPRGWKVVAADGAEVGRVRDLLVDLEAQRVRYLDVELDAAAPGTGERHVLIPIGRARLHDAEDRVLVDALPASGISSLPRYGGSDFDREYEGAIRRGFFPDGITPEMLAWMAKLEAAEGDFYGAEDFDEALFLRDRGSPALLGAATEAEAARQPDAPDREVARPTAREGTIEAARERAGLVEPGADVPRPADEPRRPGPDAEWNEETGR